MGGLRETRVVERFLQDSKAEYKASSHERFSSALEAHTINVLTEADYFKI